MATDKIAAASGFNFNGKNLNEDISDDGSSLSCSTGVSVFTASDKVVGSSITAEGGLVELEKEVGSLESYLKKDVSVMSGAEIKEQIGKWKKQGIHPSDEDIIEVLDSNYEFSGMPDDEELALRYKFYEAAYSRLLKHDVKNNGNK